MIGIGPFPDQLMPSFTFARGEGFLSLVNWVVLGAIACVWIRFWRTRRSSHRLALKHALVLSCLCLIFWFGDAPQALIQTRAVPVSPALDLAASLTPVDLQAPEPPTDTGGSNIQSEILNTAEQELREVEARASKNERNAADR